MVKVSMSGFPSDTAFSAASPSTGGEHLTRLEALCGEACELACAIFGLPMAYIRLIEDDVLATRGLAGLSAADVSGAAALTARWLVAGEGVTLSDASRDPRFFLEPAILRAPGIRFHTDMPLVRNGIILGVIALCDAQPRHDFSAGRQGLLLRYANQVAALASLALGSEAPVDLKAQQSRVDRAADLSGIGVWTIDLKTRAVTWSKGLYDLFGLSPEAFTPQIATQLDLYEAGDQTRLIEGFQRAVTDGEDFDLQVQILRRTDNTLRALRIKGGVETDSSGTPARLCAVARDVTVAETPAYVAPASEPIPTQGLDMAAAKDEFLSHIANELKTPLKDIISYARLAEGRDVAPDIAGPDIADYASGLLNSAQSLQSLIGDTIHEAAPEPAAPLGDATCEMDDDIVDVAEILDESVTAFADMARLRGNTLRLNFADFASRSAHLDVMRVQQVLANLISNACKFTKDGTITVTASQVAAENSVTAERETRLHVSVRDTGAGMSDAQSQAAFSGLGLSVSRTIIDLLGGHIGLTSRPGQGTNAWFEIPVAWVDASATAPAPQRAPTATPVPTTLTRENPAAPPVKAANPGAYAPRPVSPRPVPSLPQAIDEDRINREYLKALLADMKLDWRQ